MKLKTLTGLLMGLTVSISANAHKHIEQDGVGQQTAIVDLKIAQDLGLPVVYQQKEFQLAVAKLNESQRQQLSELMHKNGRCGGYEVVDIKLKSEVGPFLQTEQSQLESLFKNMPSNKARMNTLGFGKKTLAYNPMIAEKVKMVSEDNLRDSVTWMSSYTTRHHQSATKNDHVTELKNRLTAIAKDAKFPVEIEFVSHNRTQQNSLRARIVGSERPNEIVVLGGHFDSINQSFFDKTAPGADDNASGSANLLEIFRILVTADQPKRSIEFFWYAAEEVGLYGSSEIATEYKSQNKNVIGVLQLDMTLHPGSGEFKLVFMTDFTSPELTQYAVDLNNLYVKAAVEFDKCGYGCSDHASWHRQGYAAIMPFEATFNGMSPNIHTARDLINAQSSFKHSAGFAKLGVAYAMALASE